MNSTALMTISEDTARHILALDGSLNGNHDDEVHHEELLAQRVRKCDVNIQTLLKMAGIKNDGTEILSVLEREETRSSAELDACRVNMRKTMGEGDNAFSALAHEMAQLDAELSNIQADLKDTETKLFTINETIARLYGDIEDNTARRQQLECLIAESDELEARKRNLCEQSMATIRRRDKVHAQIRTLDRRVGSLKGSQKAHYRDAKSRLDAIRDAIATVKEKQHVCEELSAVRERLVYRASAQDRERKGAMAAIQEDIDRLVGRQPWLARLGPEGYGQAAVFPEVFSFGRFRLEGGNIGIDFPRALPFPISTALFFPENKTATGFVREFLLRAFQCLPPESLEITVCDPMQMGASLNGFQGLLENRKPFPEQRFLTMAKDIEAALLRLHGDIDSFLQRDCTGEINDWSSYNAAHPGRPRLYRLLVMFDLPDQLSDTAATYLVKIVLNGPKCGILPLLVCRPENLDPHRHGELRSVLEKAALNATRMRDMYMYPVMLKLRNLRITGELPCDIPDAAGTADALARLKDDFGRRDKFAGAMEALWEGAPLWGVSSEDGLEAAIGWREDDRATPVVFAVGSHKKPVHHALLGGKSGSGKTNLVHVLLHCLCHRYSPRELNLYLLDYKEAVEFSSYANPLLPHAAGIATESDVEYGLSVLRHLDGEMSRRADLFKEAAVSSIYEYRTKTGRPMPRILLVIDEFQRLFETPREGEMAEAMLSSLLRQGRSSGIHLLLATQTLSGLRNLASVRSLLSQISCRIALSCIPEDSMTLLQNDNLEAASLSSPPQGIYNEDLGVKSANVKFIVPEAIGETRRRHLETLREAADAQCMAVPNCRVFNGTALPAMPPFKTFAEQAAMVSGLRLLVGRTADFAENAVVADMTGKNLLVVCRYGGGAGIRESVARSLAAAPGQKSFLLYTERPEVWETLEGPDSCVTRVNDEWGCENLDEFAAGKTERKVVVLDGFENLRALRSTGYVSMRNGPSAAERLRSLVERPEKSGVQLVLCFRDYGRALAVAKDLLAVCDIRIGDASLSDPAKFAAFDAVGSHDIPLPKGTKAILIDRDTDGPILFRPFTMG